MTRLALVILVAYWLVLMVAIVVLGPREGVIAHRLQVLCASPDGQAVLQMSDREQRGCTNKGEQ